MKADQLISSLKSLYRELVIKRSPLIEYLSEGVNNEIVIQLAIKYDLHIPEDILAIYNWKNGCSLNSVGVSVGDLELFKMGIPMSIQSSIDAYEYYSISHSYWGREYFPLFESGVGEFYLYNLNINSPEFGMIMYFAPSIPHFEGIISKADSLQSMIDTILECYKKEIYYFGIFMENRTLLSDPIMESELWELKNPNSQYWKILREFV